MRVLYIHQHFSSPNGSTGIRSYAFARKLIERGHDVTVLAGSYKSGDTGLVGPFVNGMRTGVVDGINVVEFDVRVGNVDSFSKRAAAFVKYAARSTQATLRGNWDVVFATSTPLTAAIPGIAWTWLKRKPFIFEVRDLWPELPKAMGVIKNPLVLGAMSVLEWAAYRSCSAAIGLAPGIVEGIRARSKSSLDVKMIPNAADLTLFTPEGEATRPEGIAPENFLAVFTGAHGKANGLDAALDAAAELKRRNRHDIQIAFIGDGAEKIRLMERASAEGLHNCSFHGLLRKDKLAAMMRGADAGLMLLANVPAFYRGTSPNKFFDYCSAGLPVINNYGGWLAGMIKQEDCGIVVPPENASAFADALITLADNRAMGKAAGARGRAFAEKHFNRDDLAEQFVDFIEHHGRSGSRVDQTLPAN